MTGMTGVHWDDWNNMGDWDDLDDWNDLHD